MAANAEPPVIVIGGSVTVELNQADFPGAPRQISANVQIAGVIVEDDAGKTHTINFPTGKFKLTLIRK